NIKEKIQEVTRQFQSVVGSRRVIVVPTMSDPEEGVIFGIDQFKLCLFQVLPDAVRFRFARMAKIAEKASQEVIKQLDKEAGVVIAAAATTAAGAVAANWIPASDFLLLVPIQIGMIIKIGSIYGKTVNRESAWEVICALGAGFAART